MIGAKRDDSSKVFFYSSIAFFHKKTGNFRRNSIALFYQDKRAIRLTVPDFRQSQHSLPFSIGKSRDNNEIKTGYFLTKNLLQLAINHAIESKILFFSPFSGSERFHFFSKKKNRSEPIKYSLLWNDMFGSQPLKYIKKGMRRVLIARKSGKAALAHIGNRLKRPSQIGIGMPCRI